MLIYKHNHYRDVIQYHIEGNASVKGYKSTLAKAGGFHPSYLSQILSGQSDITLDQGAGLCEFFGFDDEESNYFFILILHARASHGTLKRILTARLESIKDRRAVRKWGDFVNSELDLLNTIKVASHWEYSAVWAALDLPLNGTPESIAAFLRITKADVENALAALEEMKLVECIEGTWRGMPGKSISLYGSREVTKILIQTHFNKYLSDFDKIDNYDRTIFHPVSEETSRKVDAIAKRCYKDIHETIVNCTEKKERLVGFHCSLFKI